MLLRMADPREAACADASGATLEISRAGRIVRARMRIRLDAIRPLFDCMDVK
jgi:hypothetical protein